MGDFNITFGRDEYITALNDMKVSIPPRTKLSDEALDKRLSQALNAAQMTQKYITKSTLNVSKLPVWTSRSVYDNIRRGDLHEALAVAGARERGDHNPFPLYKNAFMDLRQTLMSLAKYWDTGVNIAIVQDLNQEKCAINIRVLGVHKLDNQTPILLVLYMLATTADPWPGIRWVQEQQRRGPGMLPNTSASDLELKLLAKLLSMNAKLLPSNFKPKKLGAEEGFKPSFLLPVGPLPFEDLGKLNSDYGCAVCGEKSSKRCAQCQSVSYCSAECQHIDWPQHKKTCRSLKGGAWLTLPFVSSMPHYAGQIAVIVNRFNSTRPEESRTINDDSVPTNIHADKVFLIKIQIGGMDGEGNFLIYDRQRSMQVYFVESMDRELFRKFRAEIEGPRGGYNGLKMYRWAKRTGDLQFDICLDRAPQEDIKW